MDEHDYERNWRDNERLDKQREQAEPRDSWLVRTEGEYLVQQRALDNAIGRLVRAAMAFAAVYDDKAAVPNDRCAVGHELHTACMDLARLR